MKYLKISNKGEIEVEAFSLIGASSKRGDNSKIGMFGSGNKYAIAYLLRNNYEVIVNSGNERIDFTTSKKTFRGEDFDQVIINGNETSITTQMGHKWDLWQAVREVYSNATDEGILFFDKVADVSLPEEGRTDIYISLNDELFDFLMDFDTYFISKEREPIFENKIGRVYRKIGTKAGIYRKGIKVYDTELSSLFDYDFNEININESRVVEYYWNIGEKIWEMLFSCNNNYVIRKVVSLIGQKNLIENNIGVSNITDNISESWELFFSDKQVFSEDYAGWLNEEEKKKTTFLPGWLYRKIESAFKINKPKSVTFSSSGHAYDIIELDDLRAKTLSQAIDFFTDAKFKMDYNIKVVDFKQPELLGSIDQEKKLMLISVKCLDKGVDEVVNTAIEEYIHLKYGVADETRGFQTSVITEFVNYMKSKI